MPEEFVDPPVHVVLDLELEDRVVRMEGDRGLEPQQVPLVVEGATGGPPEVRPGRPEVLFDQMHDLVARTSCDWTHRVIVADRDGSVCRWPRVHARQALGCPGRATDASRA